MKVIILNTNKKVNDYYHNFSKFVFNAPKEQVLIKFKNLQKMNLDTLYKIERVMAQGRSIKNLFLKCSFVGVNENSRQIQIIKDNVIPYK